VEFNIPSPRQRLGLISPRCRPVAATAAVDEADGDGWEPGLRGCFSRGACFYFKFPLSIMAPRPSPLLLFFLLSVYILLRAPGCLFPSIHSHTCISPRPLFLRSLLRPAALTSALPDIHMYPPVHVEHAYILCAPRVTFTLCG
jgi:hypothetical protein